MRIVGGQVLQHLGQSGQHPSVAACPEVFLAAGGLVFRIDILAVAEVEAGLAVEHDAVAVEDVLIELVQVFHVARQLIHLGHNRHHHVERIRPPPVVVHLGVGLIAHHLLGTRHLPLVGREVVEVDVRLEADLPVAEEHIVLSLAISLVFPFGRVGFGGAFPLVVLRPSDAVVEHLLVLEQSIHLHVARVIGGIVPKRTHFGRVVALPVVVHTSDDVSHLVARAGLTGHCREKGKAKNDFSHLAD